MVYIILGRDTHVARPDTAVGVRRRAGERVAIAHVVYPGQELPHGVADAWAFWTVDDRDTADIYSGEDVAEVILTPQTPRDVRQALGRAMNLPFRVNRGAVTVPGAPRQPESEQHPVREPSPDDPDPLLQLISTARAMVKTGLFDDDEFMVSADLGRELREAMECFDAGSASGGRSWRQERAELQHAVAEEHGYREAYARALNSILRELIRVRDGSPDVDINELIASIDIVLDDDDKQT